MKTYCRAFLVAFFVLFSSVAFASDFDSKESNSLVAKKAQSFISARVSGSFVLEVGDSPIPGVYEVLAVFGQNQPNIFYYYPEKDLVLAGNLIDSSGKPLGLTRLQAYQAKKINDIDLADAIKIGNGPVEVVEFTDPDCSFCRKLDQFLTSNHSSDVTRYVFLFPLSNIHPKSEAKSRYVLCSADPAAELANVLAGKFDREAPKIEAGYCDAKMAKHHDAAKKAGISGTPVVVVDKKRVDGFNVETIARYIAESVSSSLPARMSNYNVNKKSR